MTHEIKSIAAFQASLVFALVNFVFGAVAAIAMALAPMTPMMEGPACWCGYRSGTQSGAFVVSAIF